MPGERRRASPPTVFISYCRKDEPWKKRLRTHLTVLENSGYATIRDDTDIDPGRPWQSQILHTIDQATVAVCLISADYLASRFCAHTEIPYLLARASRGGLVVIPLLVSQCLWNAVPWLSETQLIPGGGKTIASNYASDWDSLFTQVTRRVLEATNP